METHDLKIEPEHFRAVSFQLKKAEIRKNDRDFKDGDWLKLREYDRDKGKYTGDLVKRRITHITPGGQHGIESGYVLLSLSKGR